MARPSQSVSSRFGQPPRSTSSTLSPARDKAYAVVAPPKPEPTMRDVEHRSLEIHGRAGVGHDGADPASSSS